MFRKYKPTNNELIVIRRAGFPSIKKEDTDNLNRRLSELKKDFPDLHKDIDNLFCHLRHLDYKFASRYLKRLPDHIETGKYRPTEEGIKALKALGYVYINESNHDEMRTRLREAEISDGDFAIASEKLADEIDDADNAEIPLDYDYINAKLR